MVLTQDTFILMAKGDYVIQRILTNIRGTTHRSWLWGLQGGPEQASPCTPSLILRFLTEACTALGS